MQRRIFGRDHEKALLNQIMRKSEPAFIAVYGRRRVGKTYLIREYFKNDGLFFHLTGIKDAKTSAQLKNFSNELSDVFLKGSSYATVKDWSEAFNILRKELEKIQGKEKVVLFFDELPWLASPRSGFMQALDHFWNRYLSSMKNCVLIVCGSAASWMINKVLNSSGGLHGRVTHEIPLLPFDLKETKAFLEYQNVFLDPIQVIELYFALGGVAKYLTYVEPGLSSAQTINRLCFTRNGPLRNEFHRLYRSLFNDAEAHIVIVKSLASIKSGLTYSDLAKKTKIPSGGRLTGFLKELETSGFIHQVSTFGKGIRGNKYVLTDEFSLFYLTWMEESTAIDLDDDNLSYWMNRQSSSRYESWKGFAFERVCMKHLQSLKRALGISSVITKTSKWRSDGVEIDWVIDREDRCINLFEAKFVGSEFQLTKAYSEALRKKKSLFRQATHTKKALFTTMITPYGVNENTHYLGSVDNQLTIESLMQ